MSHAALFLDRDGVINQDYGYVHKPEDVVFVDGIFELVSAAKQAGYPVIVVTNQAGIGRGYYSEADFNNLMDWMKARFAEHGGQIDAVYFCPFHLEHGVGDYKKDSFDRKPNPGMLLRAAEEYGLDLSRSIMIGDKDSDMQAASKAGVDVRCHFISDANSELLSDVATRHVTSLRDVITFL